MDDETTLVMTVFKMIQSGQIKNAIEDLNRSVANLKQNLDGVNQSVVQLNKELMSSNAYLKDIAELNKSASRQTTAMYILTIVMVLFMLLQILIMKGII